MSTTRLWTTPPRKILFFVEKLVRLDIIHLISVAPANPTWAIIGGLAGGIGGLGLIGVGVGVYMCYRSSQQRSRTRVRQSMVTEQIPLGTSDHF